MSRETITCTLLVTILILGACGADDPPDPFSDPGPGTIKTGTQAIYLDFLQEYQTALARFGLAKADTSLRKAIRSHLRQNVAAYDIAVLTDVNERRLVDAAQIASIHLRNTCPLGHILSIDNTSANKDIGNKVRNEHVGGFNQAVADLGYPGHGGVFVTEHFVFSELIQKSGKAGPNPSVPSSTVFDQIFRPFAPELGGQPLERFPGSRDDVAATKAIDALAAGITATLTTLTGYLVGLPDTTDPLQFSNTGDNGCYMDLGSKRTFSERAKLNGVGEKFCPDNDAYLRTILPL